MKKVLFIVATLIYFTSFAQKAKEDVLYLKNSTVLKGKIEAYNNNNTLTFITYSGNTLTISQNEIDSIKNEKIKHLDIFYYEKEKLNKKMKFISSFNFITGFHTNFGVTKTISNQLLIDAGVRLRNKFSISAGLGFIQYLNLSPNEYMLINGANNYTAIPHKNNLTNSSVLYHLPVYSNLSVKLFNLKETGELYLGSKYGYIYYAPEKFHGTIRTDRRNNAEVYNLSYVSKYNPRMFVHPELVMQIPTFENNTQFKLGLGYYLDYLTINYSYTEHTFINTNYMLPSVGYWQKREFSQKEKAYLGFLTFCVGFSF